MLRLLRGVTQLESKVHELYEKAAQQMTEKQFKDSGRTHTMTTRSQSGPSRFQCPLLTSSTGMTKHVPFSLGDVQVLVDKLPPIAGCGRVWLQELDILTKGMTLALGDFRAILGQSVRPSVAREIEQNADCSKDPDDTP
ncbi:hypothetical protein GOODEAATRI_027266 [Goodea atripinnis]|uniref:Uncharacterized protein n=1 Tax=Goodea atripinnis TaxID=208336 RepID=A0ABV0MYN3_9TELE